MADRKVFVGLHTSQRLKATLESEAERRGMSMSILAETLLERGLKGAKPDRKLDPDRSWKRGRKLAIRGTLSSGFRAAILAHEETRESLARAAGFIHPQAFAAVLRDSGVVMSEKTLARLDEVARIVGYRGALWEKVA